jgi:hypothetical protein
LASLADELINCGHSKSRFLTRVIR